MSKIVGRLNTRRRKLYKVNRENGDRVNGFVSRQGSGGE